MNPMATILSAVVASAAAAPTAQWAAAPLAAPLVGAAPALAAGYAHGLAVAAPAVAVAHAAPAISVPAPYETSHQAPATASVHQPPQQISKQVHYGQQTYIAGYNTEVLKPAIPDISIAVPTALKGTEQVNPAVVKVQKEPYVVNEAVPVERPYAVPYDVPVHVEKIVEVPTPVHVAKPYAVPQPYPVRGQDIVKVSRTAPIVKHTHAGHYAAAPAIAAAAPAYGVYAHGALPAVAHGAALPAIAHGAAVAHL